VSRIPSASSVSQPTSQPQQAQDLRDVDMDQFLQLLIAELQNQDPLSPMENSELLQQISQIREIGATNQLSDTLQTVVDGQNLATASSLIGKHVTALSDEGSNVEGVVERVSLERDDRDETQRQLRVHVGDQKVRLQNIRDIVAAP
jgi:flagellar basal-body rod modification protein FlgD